MGPARLVPQLGWFALLQAARLALLDSAPLDSALLDSALLARQVTGLALDPGRLALLSAARLGVLRPAWLGVLRPAWLGAGDQVDEWPQVGAAYLENVIALLAQWPRDRPVPVHGDMHENDPDPEVLHLGDHLGKILFAADEDSVGDRPVSGQGVQVTVHLGLDAL